MSQERILLEETFYVLTKKNSVFRVRLTKKGCKCLRSKKSTTSCSCQSLPRTTLRVVEENSGEQDETDISAYLYIYAYILQNNKNGHCKRERTIITLRFRSFDKYEDNNKEAKRWRNAIKQLIKGEQAQYESSETPIMHKINEQRKLLVLCNPKSGPGRGKAIFQDKIVPILQEAEIPYDLHITKHANYARDFVRTCNIYQWSGVVVVGGDGIVFEVINGMFERPDWHRAVENLPVAVVPGGSGNGLARSIAYYTDEPYLPTPTLPSALSLVRNRCVPMDLVRVENTSQIIFSFLSVGWGLLSDIDIESERLRMLGGQRFTVWSVARLIGLRSYSGKVYYLPIETETKQKDTNGNPIGASTLDLPTEVTLETQEGRQRLDSWYSAASKRSAYFSATGSSYQSTADSSDEDSQGKCRMYGPASQLPCLTASLPSNWVCLEGKFVMVHASYQSHLGEDALFAPASKLNDGTIWLLIIRGNVTRSQLLHFLLGLSTAAHVQNTGNGIDFIPVRAFRIEPDMDERGYITVDGEHVEYGPIQAEVFPGLAKIMVP
ncbi:sphingosine kinase [Holotrichia oblita]|uniref:Sphingosine kinase n=1 Tax=Holotrichia oblita TaxID=644536 RepID=A0ACB9TYF8_HOLOL|nr:sphingosine kinase [Holotrichia oblita]